MEKERQELVNKGKFLNKSQLLVIKHQKEQEGLRKKHGTQRKELEMQRKKEFEIVERRFVNVWNEMEARYRKEILKLDRMSPVKKMKLRETVMSKANNRSFL